MSNEETIKKKQSAEQAVPYAPHFMREVLEQSKEDVTIEPGEHVDKVLLELSQSEAWKILKTFINEKRKRLETYTRESVRADSFDLQNTGFRYLIYDQVDSFAQDIIDRVDGVARMKKLSDESPTTE